MIGLTQEQQDEILSKFPCPSEKESFLRYWLIYLSDIKHRDNLKPSHFQQLKILCDLSVEYDEIKMTLDLEGRTYSSEGRNGFQIKIRPEVAQLNRVVSEIRNYSKILGLVLVKDQTSTKGEEANEFD
jgi:hypothetical protein